jgi:hypothetical protein
VTEDSSPEGPPSPDEEAAAGGRGTAFRFFLLPLLVVGTAVGVFWIFSRMTFERRSPADYLQEVRGGTANRRWQAAFELSRSLPNLEPPEREALAAETLRIFRSLSPTRPDDVPVRRYLVLVLGKLSDPAAVEPLLAATKDPDADTRLYAVWALGKLGDVRALPAVTEASLSEDGGMRKMAAYVLGQLHDRAAAPRLEVLLGDPVRVARRRCGPGGAALDDRPRRARAPGDADRGSGGDGDGRGGESARPSARRGESCAPRKGREERPEPARARRRARRAHRDRKPSLSGGGTIW